ncbi:triadin isoform X2 [Anabrus simplex]
MPPPKPAGRARVVDKLKKGKGAAVSSKQKLGKRTTPAEFKKTHSSGASAEFIQSRPSGTPGPKKNRQSGTPIGHPKLQSSGTPSGFKKKHPSALKNTQLSVSLTKLTKPKLPSSPIESKGSYLSILTELEKSGPLEISAELKNRGPGRPKVHETSSPKGIEPKGKKRKAVDFSPARTVKRVKLKHDLGVSSSKKKGQKHSTSLKSGQLHNKKITGPRSHSGKTKSKVSENEPIAGLEYGSTLQETLAHLPLLKAKSPKPKPKSVAQRSLPVSKPVIKAAQIKKKNVQFPHSKAAIKRAQQILSQKSKGKTALVTKKKIQKGDQKVGNKQLPHSKTSVKRGKQILSQKSKMNKTVSASRKKVAKQSLTVVENESLDNEVELGSRTFYEINIPVGMAPFVNKQFWQPSVILKKLEDIVILGIKKSTKEQDAVNTEDIKLAAGNQTPVNVAEEKTPHENCEPIVRHPNSKENFVSSLTVDHSNRKKLHIIADSYRGKSKKSVVEKEVAEQVPQAINKEEDEANKIVTIEETPNHSNPDPPKGTKVHRRRSLTSGNSAIEEPQIQNSAVNQKVKGRSKPLNSTSGELEKQKQSVMKKPQSRTFLLKETDDMNSNKSMQKTVCIAVPEDTKMANNKDSPLTSQHGKTENKEISHISNTDTSILTKRKARRNSDKVLISPVSQDIRNEVVKASNVDSQSDDTPKRKRRHSDAVQAVPVKRTRLQLKDMAEHNKSLTTEQTNIDEPPVPKKKEENVKTAPPLRKTKETTKDKAKQTQDIQMEVKMSRIQTESQKSEETAKSSKSVANTAREQMNEKHLSQKQVVVVDSNISLDSVESPETDLDSDVSSYLITKESNLLKERREDPNISDQLRLLDPSFIEEANLSELLNSDSSCDNMSWNSLNVIANQRKAEVLRKELLILLKNLALLREVSAKRNDLSKDISKQIKNSKTKQVSSDRSEKI